MTTEMLRLIRHGIAPLVTWLVLNGYLPEYMQGDVTELAVIAVSVGAPMAFSWMRDKAR